MGWYGMNSCSSGQGLVGALVNKVMNVWVPRNLENS
jgi:hypothetical protein